jgi:hypothetical protein
MTTVHVARGPAHGELLRRMLSYLPVSFDTTGGPMEVLIEEMQEAAGHRFSFRGHIVSGVHDGARVNGNYACLTKNGKLEILSGGV